MSILNDIKILLDIQDKNIIFEENGVYIKNYKGSMSKFVSAKLTYIPTHCEKCGVKNDHYTIYKNGTKTSHIKLPIEGINNKIKVLSRVAYGYRNFNYFKTRIILHFKLRAVVKQKITHIYLVLILLTNTI